MTILFLAFELKKRINPADKVLAESNESLCFIHSTKTQRVPWAGPCFQKSCAAEVSGDSLAISKDAFLSFAYYSKMWEIAIQASLYFAAKENVSGFFSGSNTVNMPYNI